MVLELRTRLSEPELDAVADLGRRVVAHDGGRLKVEWENLRYRDGHVVNDLVWLQGDRVLGYLGLDVHGGPEVELAGMVDPGARDRGIGTALLAAAVDVCRRRGFRRALLIMPRRSDAGHHLARRRGATISHSEHALRLVTRPGPGPTNATTTVRPATGDDLEDLRELLAAAFGSAPPRLESILRGGGTLVVERAGETVGTLRVDRGLDAAGIYGFAVHPRLQGRGIGRDVLCRVCQDLFDDGVGHVGLEVAVGDERARGLYTSVGFTTVETEDYYDLPLG